MGSVGTLRVRASGEGRGSRASSGGNRAFIGGKHCNYRGKTLRLLQYKHCNIGGAAGPRLGETGRL